MAALESIPPEARPWARPDGLHAMDDMLLYRLRAMSPEALAGLPDVGEGLEHRLHRLCREASGREALLEALKCKRYTRARLSRLLTHALLGLDRQLAEAIQMPRYARLIAAQHMKEKYGWDVEPRVITPVRIKSETDTDDGEAGPQEGDGNAAA